MIREELGLNKPVVRQYIDWVSDIFHGDLGNSIKTGKPVTYEISLRYHNTLRLAGIALVWGVALGLLRGMLIMLFSVKLRWFPVSGSDTWKHMVLPVLTLGTGLSATIARFTRSSIIEAMKGDYTRTARAKGLSESTVIWKHVFRNSMISVVTVVGLQFGHLLGGSVLVEAVFGLSGLGSLMVDSINNRDYFMIQALILIFALNFVVINLLVDLLYAALNPEISYK